jgi:uncharacterized protein (TIGR00255 family)
MLVSMTGFGRIEFNDAQHRMSVELKSVNNRYLDISIRLPRDLNVFEEKIRQTISKYANRGRVECSISYQYNGSDAYEILINSSLAAAYQQGVSQLSEALALNEPVRLSQILALPDVLKVERHSEDSEMILQYFMPVLEQALLSFSGMRQQEGQRLAEDLLQRLTLIETLKEQVALRAPFVVEEYSVKLKEKILVLLQDHTLDETRLITEVALMANRTDITEEIVRLTSHCSEFRRLLLQENDAVGRKLDFLMQEMNREVNTIGSKANDYEIGKIVIEMKSELEKMREQVQNIE